MKGFEGGVGGMTGRIEEIVENRRIVMTDHFDKLDKCLGARRQAG